MANRVHALRYYGAPHDDDGELIQPGPKTTSGEGRAKCKCGALSPILPTGLDRRGWFDIHRDVSPVQLPKTSWTDSEEGTKATQPFPATFALDFWTVLGRDAARKLLGVQTWPADTPWEPELSWDADALEIYLEGHREDVEPFIADLRALWEFVDREVPEWRDLLPADMPEPAPGPDQRRVSRELKAKFYEGLVDQFIEKKELEA